MADPGNRVSPEHESVNDVRSETPREQSLPQPRRQEVSDGSPERAAQMRTRAPEVSVERARKLGAENFDGSGSPDEAIVWLDHMGDVCDMMECSDAQKVRITTFLFKGRARDWWFAMKRRFPVGLTWEEFVRHFEEKFHPTFYTDAKI